MRITRFERRLLGEVTKTAGLHGAAVLHPSVMYRTFKPFWRRHEPEPFPEAFLNSVPWDVDVDDALKSQLPSRYVTARFYHNENFPQTNRNVAFVSKLVESLAGEIDVVLLASGAQVDQHVDLLLPGSARVHRIDQLLSPRNNLAVQTRIIAGAQVAFSTYGGFSYVPPFCGVPSVSFTSDPSRFLPSHLEVAQRMFDPMRRGAFVVLNTEDEPSVTGVALRYVTSEGRTGWPRGRSTGGAEDRKHAAAASSRLIAASRDRRLR
jgi:hypothetical protein